MWFDHLRGAQLTEENAEDIAEWVRGKVHRTSKDGKGFSFLVVPSTRGDLMVLMGDWVVKDPKGYFRVVRLDPINIGDMIRMEKERRLGHQAKPGPRRKK